MPLPPKPTTSLQRPARAKQTGKEPARGWQCQGLLREGVLKPRSFLAPPLSKSQLWNLPLWRFGAGLAHCPHQAPETSSPLPTQSQG